MSGNNAFNHAEYGIRINANSNNNTISGNTVNDNVIGIDLSNNCEDNTIIRNIIYI